MPFNSDDVRRALQPSDGVRPTVAEDVLEELVQHAEATYAAARADGLSEDGARRLVDELVTRWRADATSLVRRTRSRSALPVPPPNEARPGVRMLVGLLQDGRYALRLARRQPRPTLLSLVTVALGISATTLLFAVAYGVMIRPLPWPTGDRVVLLKETRGGRRPRFGAISNVAYLAWRDGASTIDGIAGWSAGSAAIRSGGDSERIVTASVTPSLFPLLGARPLAGVLFDEHNTADNDVVLSEQLWRTRFGADPALVGSLVRLDDDPYRVVGILPDSEAYPDSRTLAWLPMTVAPSTNNGLTMFSAIARLRPGMSPTQAQSEATARGQSAPDTGMTTMAIFGSQGAVAISATPIAEALTADVQTPIVLLLAAVSLLLLIAAGNVAGLQLARSATRRRELAIRLALGADHGRLSRQLLVENLLLGLAGGFAGVLLAWWSIRGVRAVLPADFPRLDAIRLDGTVLGAAMGVTILTGLFVGWLPALSAGARSLVSALRDDASGGRGVSTSGRTRVAIMAAQVALTALLLIAASLVGRSFVSQLRLDRGYESAAVSTTRLLLPSPRYTAERRYGLLVDLLASLSAAPGVTDAAFVTELPVTAGGSTASFTLQSPVDGHQIAVQASPRIVSPRAITTLGLRVVTGRAFTDADIETSEPVAVVNSAFARRYLGDRPLDVHIPMGVGYGDFRTPARVIGVVSDVRYLAATDPTQPEIYYSFRQLGGQMPVGGVFLLLRASSDPAGLSSTLRAVIAQADRTLAPSPTTTLRDRIIVGLARPRLYAIVLGTFGVLALVVASVGLFAVLSQLVAARTRELAIRAALGATGRRLMRLVVGQAAGITAAGLLVGLSAAFVVTPLIGSLLYGVGSRDLPTYAAVAGFLILIAAVTAVGPARRAAHVDPVQEMKNN